jgi:hypothetical protein
MSIEGGIYRANIVKRFFTQEFFLSGLVQWSLIASIILNVANWGFLFYFIRPVDFPIILHYNVYFGVDIIGKWLEAYYLPLIGDIMLIVNAILGYMFYLQKERVVAHLLLLATFFVQVSISIAVASIILINY